MLTPRVALSLSAAYDRGRDGVYSVMALSCLDEWIWEHWKVYLFDFIIIVNTITISISMTMTITVIFIILKMLSSNLF